MSGHKNEEKNIFKDEHLNHLFHSQGWVLIDLDNKEMLLNVLEELQQKLQLKTPQLEGHQNSNCSISIHSTFLDRNKVYKDTVRKVLSPFFESFLQKHIPEYKTIQLNIFNKLPHSGYLSPHQNLTTVDEDFHTSLSVWIPLQDTDEKNGCLYFLPASHRKFEKYRNPYIYWPPLKWSPKMEDYRMTPVKMKLGQVVIFDDSIVHASPDNLSETPRVSFHAIAIPKNAPPVYPRKNNQHIDIIQVDENFWHYYSPGDPEPTLPVIRRVPYIEKIYHQDDILQR